MKNNFSEFFFGGEAEKCFLKNQTKPLPPGSGTGAVLWLLQHTRDLGHLHRKAALQFCEGNEPSAPLSLSETQLFL